jgi:hypothetical protein
MFKDFDSHQKDFKQTSYAFAVVASLALNLMFLAPVVAVGTNSYPEFREFIVNGWARTKEYYEAAHDFLEDALLLALNDLLEQLLLLICEDCVPQATN